MIMKKNAVLILVAATFFTFLSCEKNEEDKTPSFEGTWVRTEQVDYGSGPVTMTHTVVMTKSTMVYTSQNPDQTRINEYSIDSYDDNLKHIKATCTVSASPEHYPVGTVSYSTYQITGNQMTMVSASEEYPLSGTTADENLGEILAGPFTKQ